MKLRVLFVTYIIEYWE